MTKTPEILSEGEIASRVVGLRAIRFEHSTLREIRKMISAVRAEVRCARAELAERQAANPDINIKPTPLPVIVIYGPSGTGKSHIITSYKEEVVAKENNPKGKKPIIDFELSGDANKRQFAIDTLTAYKDEDPDKGTDSILRRRMRILAKDKETEFGLVDEVQHFIESDTEKRKKSVGDAFKKTVNAGLFGLGLFGTENTIDIIKFNVELAQRVTAIFELKGANENSTEEITTYKRYLSHFRTEIERRGFISSAATLEDPQTVARLFLAAHGQFGTTERILEPTLRIALQEGSNTLLPKHFWLAIQRGRLLFGCKDNPFDPAA